MRIWGVLIQWFWLISFARISIVFIFDFELIRFIFHFNFFQTNRSLPDRLSQDRSGGQNERQGQGELTKSRARQPDSCLLVCVVSFDFCWICWITCCRFVDMMDSAKKCLFNINVLLLFMPSSRRSTWASIELKCLGDNLVEGLSGQREDILDLVLVHGGSS